MKDHPDKRARAVRKVAHERFGIVLEMEHAESARTITIVELRRALEDAYDLGARSALS